MASRSRITVREHEHVVARHMHVHQRDRKRSYSEKFGSIVRGIMAVICMRRVVQDSDGTTSGAHPGAMATTEAWSGRGEKRLLGVAPQDMRGCGIGSYIWGQKVEVIIDTLVLGHSLEEHGHKAKRFLCINDDTGEMAISRLLRAFWHLVPVEHVKLPHHLRGSEQKRLQGVYSKLQTMRIFSHGNLRQERFLLMDADMLVRSNMDEVFSTNVPAAVMRGEADTCLFEPRPRHTYYQDGDETSFTVGKRNMKGGINGGLVLFKPDRKVYDDMWEKLQRFTPVTKMAEQEYWSYYYAGRWNGIHKRNNLQIHQVYFTKQNAPRGQSTKSTMNFMIQHPEEVRVYHYSADMKPSEILVKEMKAVQGWLDMDSIMEQHLQRMMEQHGARNEELQMYPEWVTQIQKFDESAHREWFDAWKRTYAGIIDWVLTEIYQRVICQSQETTTRFKCDCCLQEWDEDEVSADPDVIRDHMLFNCESMASSVRLPIRHATNLLALFYVPCGPQVEGKLCYLAEVLDYYSRYDKRTVSSHGMPQWTRDVQPKITLALYSIPRSILAVTEDMCLDAATASQDVQEKTCRQMQRKVKRAFESLKKWPPGFAWVKDKEKMMTLVATTERLHEAVKWLADNAPEMDFAEAEAEEAVPYMPISALPEASPVSSGCMITGLPPPPPPPKNHDTDDLTEPKKKRTLMKTEAKWPAPPPPPRVPPR